MMFRFALVAVLVLGQAAALAETKWFHPRHAKPEDVESVVNRLAPKAGIAAVPRQGAVLVNATSEVLDEVSRIIRELDQPNQTVEFEIGITGSTSSSERTLGTGIGIRRAGATNPDAGSPPPTELRQTSGSSSSA
ncbi:MAG: hypothetical protein HY815_22750, partial [Candidatus Riflebacteria bacterium]|nr:hypothetical protein [Candidatus Riflebacteria bacterium]